MGNSKTRKTRVRLYTDGGTRGNPGPSAWAFMIVDYKTRLIAKGSGFMGESTNNTAEFMALLKGLEECSRLNMRYVIATSDNQLVVETVNGRWKLKAWHLATMLDMIRKTIKSFDSFFMQWAPREIHEIATVDRFVNDELDKHTQPKG